jgi:predicted RNA-binding Zn ribbon-like protein
LATFQTLSLADMAVQIEEKVDQALDAVVAGDRKSLDELIEWFPADSGLRDLLRAAEAIRSLLSATPPPEVRARHLAQMNQATRAMKSTQKGRQRRRSARLRGFLLRPVVVLAVVALLAAVPLAALASVAGPGDALYGTKLALERVQLALERDPVEDVKLHLEFADQRISDLSELLAEGRTDEIGEAMSSLNAHVGQADHGVSDLQAVGQSVVSLQQHLAEVLGKHVTVLQSLIAEANCDPDDPDAGEPQCFGLLTALKNSSKVLDEVGPTQQKAGHGRPETAGEGARGNGPPAGQVPATGPAGEAPPGKSNGPPSELPGRGTGTAP